MKIQFSHSYLLRYQIVIKVSLIHEPCNNDIHNLEMDTMQSHGTIRRTPNMLIFDGKLRVAYEERNEMKVCIAYTVYTTC